MKPFHLEPSMVTLRGVFYPTGYMVLMFPTEKEAREAELALEAGGISDEETSLVTPEAFEEEIDRALGGDPDDRLPSVGTEADTVRRFRALARKGHHALIVHAPSAKISDRVMELLKGANISYGQKYRHLVIQDLVS